MVADIFTKALPNFEFNHFVAELRMTKEQYGMFGGGVLEIGSQINGEN